MGFTLFLVEETEGGKDAEGSFIPALEAHQAVFEMVRDDWDLREVVQQSPPYFQGGKEVFLDQANGQLPQGEFGTIETSAIGRADDGMDELHALKKAQAVGHASFAQTRFLDDFGHREWFFRKIESGVDEGNGPREAEGLGKLTEVNRQFLPD